MVERGHSRTLFGYTAMGGAMDDLDSALVQALQSDGRRSNRDLARQAMITVRLRPQSRAIMHGFRDFVAALPETLNVYVTTGFEDLLVHVAVPSTDALQDFVLDSLTKRKEVSGVRTEVVFEHVRNHVVAPVRTPD